MLWKKVSAEHTLLDTNNQWLNTDQDIWKNLKRIFSVLIRLANVEHMFAWIHTWIILVYIYPWGMEESHDRRPAKIAIYITGRMVQWIKIDKLLQRAGLYKYITAEPVSICQSVSDLKDHCLHYAMIMKAFLIPLMPGYSSKQTHGYNGKDHFLTMM